MKRFILTVVLLFVGVVWGERNLRGDPGKVSYYKKIHNHNITSLVP